jgi:hypothetical protein
MIDIFFTPKFLGPLGAILFILFFPYIQMARGKLIPRSSVQDIIDDRNAWRTAQQISETARAESAAQVEALLEHAKVTEALIKSWPMVVQENSKAAHYKAAQENPTS